VRCHRNNAYMTSEMAIHAAGSMAHDGTVSGIMGGVPPTKE